MMHPSYYVFYLRETKKDPPERVPKKCGSVVERGGDDVDCRGVVVALDIHDVDIRVIPTETLDGCSEGFPRDVLVHEEALHHADFSEVLAIVTKEVNSAEITIPRGILGEEHADLSRCLEPSDDGTFGERVLHQGGDLWGDADERVQVKLIHDASCEVRPSPIGDDSEIIIHYL
jgi:hypothetical protein